MIKEIKQENLAECVAVIRDSFATVAAEFGITEENAPRFTAFAKAKELGCTKMKLGIVEENQVLRKWYEKFGFVHAGTQKFEFFPFTCGYMEKEI